MYLAVLRVSSDGDNLNELLVRHRVTADVSWKAGDVDALGRVIPTAGFNVTVAEGDSRDGLIASMYEWLSANQPFLHDLRTRDADCIVDLGVSVDSDRPVRSIVVPADVLGVLASAGVALEFSTYLSARGDAPEER